MFIFRNVFLLLCLIYSQPDSQNLSAFCVQGTKNQKSPNSCSEGVYNLVEELNPWKVDKKTVNSLE